MENKDRLVNELLDSALAHRRSAEPPPGLEARILERVHAARTVRVRSTKLWTVGSAVAGAAVLIAAIYWANRPHGPAVQTPQAANSVSAPAPSGTLTARSGAVPKAETIPRVLVTERAAHPGRKPSQRLHAHHWPSQFPTPAPLSPEQKALVQYVRETPPQVLAKPILKAEITVQHVEIKPLEIPPLEIKPLALGPGREEIN